MGEHLPFAIKKNITPSILNCSSFQFFWRINLYLCLTKIIEKIQIFIEPNRINLETIDYFFYFKRKKKLLISVEMLKQKYRIVVTFGSILL